MRSGWIEAVWTRATDPRVLRPVLVTACAGLTAMAVKTPWSPLPRWVIAVSSTVASVAVWWYRRRPMAVAAGGAVGHMLSGNPGPLLVGLVAAAATLRPGRLAVLPVLGVAGFGGLQVIEAGGTSGRDLISAAALTLALMGIGVTIGTRRLLVESLRDRAERAEAEHHLRMQQARAGERTRIAREMHDVLAHKVALIALHAGALEVDPDAAPDRVEQSAALIGATARDALDELRVVLGILRPDDGADGDTCTDITSLVTSWQDAGVAVRLRHEVGDVPDPLARAAHRLVQEGLTNAHKHAPGSQVDVTVAGTPGDALVVSVVNGPATGATSPDLPGAGTGLVGLQERLHLARGHLHSGPRVGGGWVLEGRFPWSAGAAAHADAADAGGNGAAGPRPGGQVPPAMDAGHDGAAPDPGAHP